MNLASCLAEPLSPDYSAAFLGYIIFHDSLIVHRLPSLSWSQDLCISNRNMVPFAKKSWSWDGGNNGGEYLPSTSLPVPYMSTSHFLVHVQYLPVLKVLYCTYVLVPNVCRVSFKYTERCGHVAHVVEFSIFVQIACIFFFFSLASLRTLVKHSRYMQNVILRRKVAEWCAVYGNYVDMRRKEVPRYASMYKKSSEFGLNL